MANFGVLDQVPVFSGRSPIQSVADSLDLAAAVDRLGYVRFWIAEHHGDPSLGCASPEVLAASVAARTQHIRVGAGCVLMPYASPLRVAEAYRLLHALAPGRIDLGIGRGLAGPTATAALLGGAVPGAGVDYLEQVVGLLTLLRSQPAGQRSADVPLAVPFASDGPEVWVMGSGLGGAETAAALGLPFAFAQFVHGEPRPDITDAYRSQFRPRAWLAAPRLAIAVRVACAETERAARYLSHHVWIPGLAHRDDSLDTHWDDPLYPSRADAEGFRPDRTQRKFIDEHPYLVVTGEPDDVLARLRHLEVVYAPDDVVISTTDPDIDSRITTHELIRGLQPSSRGDGVSASTRS